MLAVRPYTHTDHQADVFVATNKVIEEVGGEANSPVPEQRVLLVQPS